MLVIKAQHTEPWDKVGMLVCSYYLIELAENIAGMQSPVTRISFYE